MEFLSYLLPLIVLYICIINSLSKFYPHLKLNPALFLGPILLLALAVFSFIVGRPLELLLWRTNYFNIGLRLDILSGLIATTVLTIGIIIIRFSVRYLEDDPKKEVFSNNVSYILSFVLAMLMSSNLLLLFLFWLGVSYFLHHLLIHFSERKSAVKAAMQKFWISRIGDIFIILSGAILIWKFNSLEFEIIFQTIEDPLFLDQHFWFVNIASIFLILGAMAKSAQFPFHLWLPHTMETPTPVSALMHAGIINAGGYLVVRMSPFFAHTPFPMSFLAIAGGFTAFLGFVIMLAQTNVKKSLAYSTISQMGFMMLQCGLGGFSIAVAHIIGHGFYKAYAFLSSGTATDFGRLSRYYPKSLPSPNFTLSVAVAICSISIIFGFAILLDFKMLERAGISALFVILSLAIAQIILSSKEKIKSILAATTILGIYIVVSNGFSYLLFSIVPQKITYMENLRGITFIMPIVYFIALYIVQNNLEKISNTELGKKIYVRALSGGSL